MRGLICSLLMFASVNAFAQKFTIVQINAKWNASHTVKLPSISGVAVQFAQLEDQPESIKSKIKSVPVVVLYKDGRFVHQWNADLSFKLNITEEDIRRVLLENSK